MGMTKKKLEEIAVKEYGLDMRELSSKEGKEAPKKEFDEESELKSIGNQLIEITITLAKEVKDLGIDKPSVYSSKSSDVVATLYEFINSKSLIGIEIALQMHRGLVIDFTCQAKSMAGATLPVEKKLRTICLGCTTLGIGLGTGFLGNVKSTIKIAEDRTLKISYDIITDVIHPKDTITLLDPDLLL